MHPVLQKHNDKKSHNIVALQKKSFTNYDEF